MIPLQALSALSGLIPSVMPSISLPPAPAFEAARPLAAIVGADPGRVLQAGTLIAGDRAHIEDMVNQARPLVEAAGADIVAIGQELLVDATRAVPGLFNPLTAAGAGASIAGATAAALVRTEQRLLQLEAELAPLVAKLDGRSEEIRQRQQGVSTVPANVPAAPKEGSAAGRAAVAAAKSQLGTPYVWGGSAPGGFDCSGLTSWAYRQAGVEIPRTAANQAVGRQVTAGELEPGDLAVWSGHVAMYAGGGMLVEAGSPVQLSPVRTENMGMQFKGFWRPTG